MQQAEVAGPTGASSSQEAGAERLVTFRSIEDLRQLLFGVASSSDITEALDRNFETLLEQIKPLRELGPHVVPQIHPDVAVAMASAQNALRSLDFGGGGALPDPDPKRVRFIGELPRVEARPSDMKRSEAST